MSLVLNNWALNGLPGLVYDNAALQRYIPCLYEQAAILDHGLRFLPVKQMKAILVMWPQPFETHLCSSDWEKMLGNVEIRVILEKDQRVTLTFGT